MNTDAESASPPPAEDIDAEGRQAILDTLKEDINAFLWTRLPGAMTLACADDIAADIHSLIEATWAALPPGTVKP